MRGQDDQDRMTTQDLIWIIDDMNFGCGLTFQKDFAQIWSYVDMIMMLHLVRFYKIKKQYGLGVFISKSKMN